MAMQENSGLSQPVRTLRIQSVLYNTPEIALEMSVRSLSRAADLAVASGEVENVELAYGDCSPKPVLSERVLSSWRSRCPELSNISYRFFGGNLGSARGHNELAATHPSEFSENDALITLNPDVRVAPDALKHLLRAVQVPSVGVAEARQIPIEHPKDYDTLSGDTSWASTACALIRYRLFLELGGFDADTFFLYLDDVDFSWRVRLSGLRVVYVPSASVFHDKRLSPGGRWISSDAEKYYSAEGALMLAHKWSRPDLVEKYLSDFRDHGTVQHKKAAQEYEERARQNRLPEPLDQEHEIGTFVSGNYAPHRYGL